MPITMVVIPQTPGNALMVNGIVLIPMAIWSPDGRWSIKKWYYMDENGVRTTGWKLIDGQWYYFNSSGVMQTDWTKINGQWYYFNSNGYWIDNNSYESEVFKRD